MKVLKTSGSAMAERPRELEQQTFVMQCDTTFTYSMFRPTFSDRRLSVTKYRILRRQKPVHVILSVRMT